MSAQVVYILLIISPESVSEPMPFGSLKSAKDSAGIGWHGEGHQDALVWTEDEDFDRWEARPADGPRFVITMTLVRP
jgi:hypothetical protein